MNNQIVLLSGDARQVYLEKELLDRGLSAVSLQNDSLDMPTICKNISLAKAILGPIPISSKEGEIALTSKHSMPWEEFIKLLHPGQIFAAGCFPNNWKEDCLRLKIHLYDYMEDEALAEYNTVATAEGVISQAIASSPYNLNQSRCLVAGYGRCGEAIAKRLKALGAKVTVCTRNPVAIAKALADGMEAKPLSFLSDAVKSSLFCFSTAPALIFTEEVLGRMDKESLISDISSAPGSVDFAAANALDIKAMRCQGLPGKYSPASSAKILASSFLSYTKTVNVTFEDCIKKEVNL